MKVPGVSYSRIQRLLCLHNILNCESKVNRLVHHRIYLNPNSRIDSIHFCMDRELNRESYDFDNYFLSLKPIKDCNSVTSKFDILIVEASLSPVIVIVSSQVTFVPFPPPSRITL